MKNLAAPFPLIEVHGAAFDRGRLHGELARERVRKSIEHYVAQLEQLGVEQSTVKELVRSYVPRIETFDDSYVEEMRGIAAGADVEFEYVVLVNARTEILHLARQRSGAKTDGDIDGCTGAVLLPSVTATKRVLHALNWDWKLECAQTAIVLRIRRDDGPDLLMMTEAGGLARAGLNSCGIAITANYMESDRDYAELGVPLALIRRKALESAHIALALHTICFTPKSASNNLLVSHAHGFAIDIECAPNETFPIYPSDGMLVHANHWLSPVALGKLKDTGLANTPDSFYRDWRVRAALEPHRGHITAGHAREALSDQFGAPFSVCRPPRPSPFGNLSATVAMLLMEPAAGTMEITPLPALSGTTTSYCLELESSAVPT